MLYPGGTGVPLLLAVVGGGTSKVICKEDPPRSSAPKLVMMVSVGALGAAVLVAAAGCGLWGRSRPCW